MAATTTLRLGAGADFGQTRFEARAARGDTRRWPST